MARFFGILAALLAAGALAAAPAFAEPIALGVNVDSGPGDPAALDAYTSVAGRSPAIVMWYQAWSEPLYYPSQMPDVLGRGATPMITWGPATASGGIPLRDIASGAWDSYIDGSAQAASAVGQPIYVRFAHEMNLAGSPWGPGVGGNTAADFVAAWRHVVDRFRADGADNVRWVWSPNVYCGGSCPFSAFYPGDAYVDWVALDGYNYGPVDGVPWMSLADVFGPSYDILTSLTAKPLMIAETASTEAGGDKAAWIADAFMNTIPSRLPRVRAVVWFDRQKETDWRVDSSPASAAAWRQVVASTTYGGSAPPASGEAGPSLPVSPGPLAPPIAPVRPIATPPPPRPARPRPRPRPRRRARAARRAHAARHHRRRRHR